MKTNLDATLSTVSRFTESLETDLAALSIEVRTGIVLAVQELLVNIVRHAYEGKSGQIEFELDQSDSQILIQVKDDAEKAFEMPETITAPDLLDLPEHGMGLFIIHQAFDTVDYKRTEGRNHWRLMKLLGENK
jgi:serine/threonine-protein kinase RsbW